MGATPPPRGARGLPPHPRVHDAAPTPAVRPGAPVGSPRTASLDANRARLGSATTRSSSTPCSTSRPPWIFGTIPAQTAPTAPSAHRAAPARWVEVERGRHRPAALAPAAGDPAPGRPGHAAGGEARHPALGVHRTREGRPAVLVRELPARGRLAARCRRSVLRTRRRREVRERIRHRASAWLPRDAGPLPRLGARGRGNPPEWVEARLTAIPSGSTSSSSRCPCRATCSRDHAHPGRRASAAPTDRSGRGGTRHPFEAELTMLTFRKPSACWRSSSPTASPGAWTAKTPC